MRQTSRSKYNYLSAHTPQNTTRPTVPILHKRSVEAVEVEVQAKVADRTPRNTNLSATMAEPSPKYTQPTDRLRRQETTSIQAKNRETNSPQKQVASVLEKILDFELKSTYRCRDKEHTQTAQLLKPEISARLFTMAEQTDQQPEPQAPIDIKIVQKVVPQGQEQVKQCSAPVIQHQTAPIRQTSTPIQTVNASPKFAASTEERKPSDPIFGNHLLNKLDRLQLESDAIFSSITAKFDSFQTLISKASILTV